MPGVSSEAPAGSARSWPGGAGQRGPPCAARTCRRWRERRPLCPLPSRGRRLRIFEVSLHFVVLPLMSEARLPESDSLPLARLGLGPHSPPRARARGERGALGLGRTRAGTHPPARASRRLPRPRPALACRVGAPLSRNTPPAGHSRSPACLRSQPVPQCFQGRNKVPRDLRPLREGKWA